MSSMTTKQYFFVPPFHLVPAMALAAILVTLSIASSVDFPLRKPYWLEDSPPASSIAALSLVAMFLFGEGLPFSIFFYYNFFFVLMIVFFYNFISFYTRYS